VDDHDLRNSSGSFAMFAAIGRTNRVSKCGSSAGVPHECLDWPQLSERSSENVRAYLATTNRIVVDINLASTESHI
jgi:hypothetical protein